MSLIVSDQGIAYQLNALIAKYGADALLLHLFQNDYTPTDSTAILSNLTEADYDGYAAATISGWASASVTSHVASSAATPIVFTKSAGATPNTIYGYYITDSASTVLYWVERDPAAPVNMTIAGNTYTVTVRDTQQSLF
jgi:hypothetical protein